MHQLGENDGHLGRLMEGFKIFIIFTVFTNSQLNWLNRHIQYAEMLRFLKDLN